MSVQPGKKQPRALPWRVHPIWRGLGCFMMILIPLIAYGLAGMALDAMAADLAAAGPEAMTLPFVGEVSPQSAQIFLTLVFSVAVFLILSILGSLLYSLFGGPRDEKRAEYSTRDPYRYK